MGTEQCKNGKSYCEIDEYKIINYNNENRWMLGIYDRGTHNIRVFFIDNNRTKDIKDYIENNFKSSQNPNSKEYTKFLLGLLFYFRRKYMCFS